MKLGVIGGGAWGTALAQVAAAGGRETLLWALEPEVVEGVNAGHENPVFLAGVPLNPGDPRDRRTSPNSTSATPGSSSPRRSTCARCSTGRPIATSR